MAAYSQLNEAERERLEMLAEEAAEVIHAVTKILRHGKNTIDHCADPPEPKDNIGDLEKEVGHFLAVAEHMMHLGDLDDGRVAYIANRAWDKKLPYTHHQDEG